MRTIAFAVATLAASCLPARAEVFLSWTGCETPIMSMESYSASDHVLTVLITGVSGTYDAVDLTIAVFDRCSQEGRYIPEAWRFDPAGCQAGALRVVRPADVSGCPGLRPGAGSVTADNVTVDMVREYVRPGVTFDYPALFVRVASTFPATALSANQKYVVAQIHFDMTNTTAGVDPSGQLCGCGSSPRGLAVKTATLHEATGFDLEIQSGNEAGWNNYQFCIIDHFSRKQAGHETGGEDPSCLTTPARARSWGALKASYR